MRVMPAIRMEPQEWEQVAAILARSVAGREVWAFGSRATGRRLKRFSDLDLLVAGRLTWAQRAELAEAFDESLLPFKVDVVESEGLTEEFWERIAGDLVAVQGSGGG